MDNKSRLSAMTICPDDQGDLAQVSDKLACRSCGKQYSCCGEVWDLRTVFDDNRKGWSAEAFDQAYDAPEGAYEDGIEHAVRVGIPRFAEEYRQANKGLRLQAFVAEKQPLTLLDLGCGTGWFNFSLFTVSPKTRFIGVDVSVAAINIFQQQISLTSREDEMSAILANGENLPFPDNSFDLVLMQEVIEHLHDSDQVFSEIRRVLNPGGFLLISTPSKLMTGFWKLAGFLPIKLKRLICREPVTKSNEKIYDRPLAVSKLKRLIKDYGFKTCRWEKVIFLPHESYLQFIPKWLLKSWLLVAGFIGKVSLFGILGLHHVVILEKPRSV